MGITIEPSDALVRIRVDADVGAARRQVERLVVACGVERRAAKRARAAVTELAGSIVGRGVEGYVLFRLLGDVVVDSPIVEILAVDHASDRVTLRRVAFGDPAPPRWLRWGGVSLPLLPGDGNGDAWAVHHDERSATFLVVDGLGHGGRAQEAAAAAVAAFDKYDGDTRAWIPVVQEAMRPTRGGVLAVARIDRRRGVVDFSGVGNVSGRVVGQDGVQVLTSTPGMVGATLAAPRVRPVEAAWSSGSTLVLWTDGVRSGVDLSRPRGLLLRDPTVVAALVHRDFQRGNDDATVVVAREAGA